MPPELGNPIIVFRPELSAESHSPFSTQVGVDGTSVVDGRPVYNGRLQYTSNPTHLALLLLYASAPSVLAPKIS